MPSGLQESKANIKYLYLSLYRTELIMPKEVLLQARKLIKQKKFKDARELLRTIPLDSTA